MKAQQRPEAADFWMNTSKNSDLNEGCSVKCSPSHDNGCIFQFLFERTSDAVWLIDPDTGVVVDCNEATAVLMRSTSRADLVGRRLEELAAPEQKASSPILEAVRRPAERFESRNTHRKQAEVELLRTLAREKELGQLRSHFVSMVSHEFRTPLGIIQSSAEILEDYLEQLEPADRKSHLQSIRNNTCRMARLMEEPLLIGSLDAGKIEFKPAPLELGPFVQKLVEEVLSATNRCCPIELLLAKIPDQIQANERFAATYFHEPANQRSQVFGRRNLITNAFTRAEAVLGETF